MEHCPTCDDPPALMRSTRKHEDEDGHVRFEQHYHCIKRRKISIWDVSRKLATSVNQGDKIVTMMDMLKYTQITLLKSC